MSAEPVASSSAPLAPLPPSSSDPVLHRGQIGSYHGPQTDHVPQNVPVWPPWEDAKHNATFLVLLVRSLSLRHLIAQAPLTDDFQFASLIAIVIGVRRLLQLTQCISWHANYPQLGTAPRRLKGLLLRTQAVCTTVGFESKTISPELTSWSCEVTRFVEKWSIASFERPDRA